MKKNILLCLPALCLSASVLVACGDDDPMPPPPPPPSDGGGSDAGGDAMVPPGCDAEVVVDADIAADTTWNCPVYVLSGKIFVTDGATLSIAAGVTVFGDTGGADESALLITRGSRIEAVGTAAEPIVFSSGNPDGARATGDWAGLALLGDATINSGSCVDDGDPGTADVCDAPGFLEGHLEGIDVADARGVFGGVDDAGDCGRLEYVRIEFAGAELSPDNELNGLTVGGCGSATTISHVQVHRGKDDGIEFFGGTANMDHVVISGASDDSLDWDLGWRGNVQFLVVHQFPGIGDNGFEADNLGSDEDAMPRSAPTLFNVTMIGTPDTRGMVLREGTRGVLRNFIVQDFGSEPLDLRAAEVALTAEWPGSLSIENSFFFGNGDYSAETGEDDDDMGFDEQAAIEDAARNNTLDVDPMIGDSSMTAPNYVPTATELADQATPTFGDTTATYAGAFEPGAAADWSADWTSFPEN